MKEVLYVNACVREESRTQSLADHLLSKIAGSVKEIRLTDEKLLPLNQERLALRDEAAKDGHFDDKMFACAHQFASADEIIIAAPFWDLSIPALLKIYLENVTVSGVTFRYTQSGMPEGLCRAKRLYIVMTSGGPMIAAYGIDYIKSLAQSFYGIPDVQVFTAEGLDIVGADVSAILDDAKRKIDAVFAGT